MFLFFDTKRQTISDRKNYNSFARIQNFPKRTFYYFSKSASKANTFFGKSDSKFFNKLPYFTKNAKIFNNANIGYFRDVFLNTPWNTFQKCSWSTICQNQRHSNAIVKTFQLLDFHVVHQFWKTFLRENFLSKNLDEESWYCTWYFLRKSKCF